VAFGFRIGFVFDAGEAPDGSFMFECLNFIPFVDGSVLATFSSSFLCPWVLRLPLVALS
jgi:hypothetical protein